MENSLHLGHEMTFKRKTSRHPRLGFYFPRLDFVSTYQHNDSSMELRFTITCRLFLSPAKARIDPCELFTSLAPKRMTKIFGIMSRPLEMSLEILHTVSPKPCSCPDVNTVFYKQEANSKQSLSKFNFRIKALLQCGDATITIK